MRTILFMWILVVVTLTSCTEVTTSDTPKRHAFCPALEKEVLKMLDIKKNMNDGSLFCTVGFIQYSENPEACGVIIILSSKVLSYIRKFNPPTVMPDKEVVEENASFVASSKTAEESSTHTVVPQTPEDTGVSAAYTFLRGEPIKCILISNSCSSKLLNYGEVFLTKDFYLNSGKDGTIINDRPIPTRIYEVVSPDSLKLVNYLSTPRNTP